MRKLILYIASSIDGYIAGPNGEIDWLFSDQDYGYKDFFASIDTVLVGRKTYDEAIKMTKSDPFPEKVTYVFTSTPRKYESRENLVFISENPVELWKWLRQREGENAWLVGGGELIKPFLDENIIDEYVIAVHPIILGKGIPLVKEIGNKVELKTKEVKTFDSGLVQIFLEPKR